MRELWNDESGVTTVEYALLLAVVALAALVGYRALGEGVNATALEANETLIDADSGTG